MAVDSSLPRWRGLVALVTDAVVHGAGAVEKVHLATARRTFHVLERIPVVAAPAQIVHVAYELSTATTYAAVRGGARIVGTAIATALDLAEGEVDPGVEREVDPGVDPFVDPTSGAELERGEAVNRPGRS
jgi:hypothetical protein